MVGIPLISLAIAIEAIHKLLYTVIAQISLSLSTTHAI